MRFKKMLIFILSIMLTIIPTCVLAENNTDKYEPPIDIDEFVSHYVNITDYKKESFSDGYISAGITTNGYINCYNNGNVYSYSLNTYAYLNTGEGTQSASVVLLSYYYTNMGTYINLTYTIKFNYGSSSVTRTYTTAIK